MKIAKGNYEFEFKGITFFITKMDDILGDLTWNIQFDDFGVEKNVFFNGGEDSLWASKREAKEMAELFIEKYA